MAKKSKPDDTPLMRQYRRAKAAHPGAVLLFHLGDFYETFGEDARIASRVLGITLTSRNKGRENPIPLAGFPVHAAREYMNRLVKAGHKVAVCEQVEDPAKAKGLVRREVTRVITPGTLLDEGLLRAGENNYIASVLVRGPTAALAYADLSTGEFVLEELDRARLEEELARLGPSECLMPEGLVRDEEAPHYGRKPEGPPGEEKPGPSEKPGAGKEKAGPEKPSPDGDTTGPVLTPYPDWAFDPETARRRLLEHFGASSLEAFGCEGKTDAVAAAGALMRYLSETQKTSLPHMRRLKVTGPSDHLAYDAEAMRNLEILETIRERRKEGSLLGVLDRTLTAMGARRLRAWLSGPLARIEPLKARQDAVAELVREEKMRGSLRDALSSVQDLERLAAKLGTGRATPRDLLALAASVEALPLINKALREAASGVLAGVRSTVEAGGALGELACEIRRVIRPDAPPVLKEGGVIADGVDEELDRLRQVRAGGKSWIAELQAREVRRTGISSLKVGYNRVFGYYIEVTRSNLNLVPPDYVRKQTLTGAERFITPELKEKEREVLGAEERIVAREGELFAGLREKAASRLQLVQEAGVGLGDLDAILSLAEVASRNRYARPELDESFALEIEEGRHPVLEQVLPSGTFVPNDLALDAESRQILVVTGPNMAGKSTYIRQAALIVVMAQTGSFVPARSARLGLADKIFARVGASDDISRGRSTFMVEMIETARVLNSASRRSLVVLDEIGRGTSTYDGISIAWAVVEHLHDSPGLGCRTLFATHYHELCAIAEELPRVANVNVAAKEWGDEVAFLYKIVPGAADRSYGIHVARLAGVPKEVVERAREVLALLESRGEKPAERARRARKKGEYEQLPLFGPPAPSEVEEALKKLDIEKLTPVEALVKLEELRKLLERE